MSFQDNPLAWLPRDATPIHSTHRSRPSANGVWAQMQKGHVRPSHMGDFYHPGAQAPQRKHQQEVHECGGCTHPQAQCACCGEPTMHVSAYTVLPRQGKDRRPQTHYFTYCDACWTVLQAVRITEKQEASA